MTQRSPIMVFVLATITLGIYGIYWLAKTKGEMNTKGAQIPTTWLIIVPLVCYYYYWKFSEGVETVTAKGMGAAVSFLLLILLGSIGMAVVQSSLNKVTATA